MAGGAVTPLGVLRNPASSANRGRPRPPCPPGCLTVETAAPGDVPAALERLRAAGVRALVVDGGDGTLREVAGALGSVFDDAAPPLALLASGNTNLVARSLGALPGRAALAPLAERLREGPPRWREVPALRLTFPDGRAPLTGFMVGWGAYARASEIAAAEIAARGAAQVRRAVLATLARALWGAEARALRAGVAARLAVDGAPAPEGPRFLGLATSLPGRLAGGFSPFWGGGEGPLRWLDADAPPRLLPLAAPLAAFGRPMRWMTRAGYRSGRARTLSLTLAGDVVLDGERFPGGAVEIAATPLRLLAP